MDTAAVPATNTSLNFKNINDKDQMQLMNNSDRLATFNFMRQQTHKDMRISQQQSKR